jgi:hypothetical protein
MRRWPRLLLLLLVVVVVVLVVVDVLLLVLTRLVAGNHGRHHRLLRAECARGCDAAGVRASRCCHRGGCCQPAAAMRGERRPERTGAAAGAAAAVRAAHWDEAAPAAWQGHISKQLLVQVIH